MRMRVSAAIIHSTCAHEVLSRNLGFLKYDVRVVQNGNGVSGWQLQNTTLRKHHFVHVTFAFDLARDDVRSH